MRDAAVSRPRNAIHSSATQDGQDQKLGIAIAGCFEVVKRAGYACWEITRAAKIGIDAVQTERHMGVADELEAIGCMRVAKQDAGCFEILRCRYRQLVVSSHPSQAL